LKRETRITSSAETRHTAASDRSVPLVRAQTSWRSEEVVDRKEWMVTCRDVAGRRRDLTVFVSQGHVVLVAPPGETAVLAPLEVGRLRAALRDAVMNASETPQL
jgi:hypothetical protein